MELDKELAIRDKAHNNLTSLQGRINNVISQKGDSDPTYYQYTQYDELIAEASTYIAKYSSDPKSLIDKLEELSYRPDGPRLIESYRRLIKYLEILREDIKTNFAFKINDKSDSLIISREYLESIKSTGAFASARKYENDLLKEKINTSANTTQTLQAELQATKLNLNETEKTLNAKEKKILSLNDLIDKSNMILDSANAQLESNKIEIAHYKEAAQKTEVARNSTTFYVQAMQNKKAANKWMAAIIVGGVAFAAFLYHIFSSDQELFKVATGIITDSKALANVKTIDPTLLKQLILVEIGKKIGSKILIISLLTYIITFLVKNYNAQMHNYIVNSHKANALKSTVDLIGTAKGDEGNDKIVLQATQAIFTTQKSGYQGVDSEPASPNLITNVIDAVSNAKKS